MNKKPLGVYIHIPFCIKKCNYCDFLSFSSKEDIIYKYIETLLDEISMYKDKYTTYDLKTIYIGGGTPSSINEEYIASILRKLYKIFNIPSDRLEKQEIEITIEVNPGTITRNKLTEYKNSGINRLSIGLQSANNEELKRLGRIHSYEEFLYGFNLAREIGFDNINVDLISGLPLQPLDRWVTSLEKVMELNPEHISAYSLIIEEGTLFSEMCNVGLLELPKEDEERKMYEKTKEILAKAGYHRYEISNYAKEGFYSKHNSSYWLGTDYLGLGLGASSLINHTRFSNTDNLESYIEAIQRKELVRVNENPLTKKEQMEEFIFLGLRMTKGINTDEFKVRFGDAVEEVYKECLPKLIENKLIICNDNNIRLTDKGIDLSNYVLAQFIL